MTERPAPSRPTDDTSAIELAWVAANLGLVRRMVAGPHFLHTMLAVALVLGLVAHIGGYLLGTSATGEPLGLIADLVANLGIALWTGGVLVVFVQVLPEARRRTAAQYLERYEAALREQGRTQVDGGSTTDRTT